MPTDPLTLSLALVLASFAVLAALFGAAAHNERRRARAFRCRLVCGRATGSGIGSGSCQFPACKGGCK